MTETDTTYTFKRNDSMKCHACSTPIGIGRNYPSQPIGRVLELWCRACGVISVFNFTKSVILVNDNV